MMNNDVKPTCLLILDGFGLSDYTNDGNAITPQTAPNIFRFMEVYPSTTLNTTGEAVGLFPGQKGNSEAGHLTIGTGRVIKQDLVIIQDAIDNGTFFKNESFKQALAHAEKYGTKLHIFSLLTGEHSAHTYPKHLYATLELAKQSGVKETCLHLFTDGRDSSPHSATHFLKELREHMHNGQEIATVMGRYWGMDRAKKWERTNAAYHAIVAGESDYTAQSAEEAIAQAYNRGETDEYVSPTNIIDERGKPKGLVQDNDVIIFVNARSDRARQLTKVFVQDDFLEHNPKAFERKYRPQNIRFVAMTDFGPDLDGIFTAFPSPDADWALAKAIGDNRKQLYISEMEKYAHVTYFLNGGYADAIDHEQREIMSSSTVKNYKTMPQMHTAETAAKIIEYFESGRYDFICANFPNADMVGHTGDFEAAKKAVGVIDTQIGKLAQCLEGLGGTLFITADHGNAEQMKNEETGEIMTEHTKNPVPFIVVGEVYCGKELRRNGTLADVAPTVLDQLGLPKPEQMTGLSLFI